MKNYLSTEDYKEIKRMVGMRQTAEFYGYQVNGKGLCLCPFHKDNHPSLKIYPHDKGFYCFSCGQGGDVVKFVAMLYGLKNEEAARKLIEDFSLPIKTETLSYREKRERDLRARKSRELERFSSEAIKVLTEYRKRLCEAIRRLWSDHFDEAAQMLTFTEYWIACLKENPEEIYANKKAVKKIETIKQRLIAWDDASKG